MKFWYFQSCYVHKNRKEKEMYISKDKEIYIDNVNPNDNEKEKGRCT